MADSTSSSDKQHKDSEVFEAPLRRLDSLARCLEGAQECVAVACINSSLFIAANGLRAGKNLEIAGEGRDTFPQPTKKIIDHFSAAALGRAEIVKALSDEIFSNQVCTLARFKKLMKAAASMITSDIYEGAIQNALKAKEVDRKFLLQKHGHNLAISAGVYSEAIDLHEAFTKIEQGLLGISKDKFIPKQIDSFKKCDKQSEEEYILHSETKSGVHAELQILGKIVQLAEKGEIRDTEIYLGISKGCCFQCHCMLEVVGDVLKETYGIKLKHRDDHDISFQGNWVYPTVLETTKLNNHIKAKFDAKILTSVAQTNISMGHGNASDSDSELTTQQLIDNDIASIKEKIKVLQACPLQGELIKDNILIMEFGLFLHANCKEFKDFFTITLATPTEQINDLTEALFLRLNVIDFLNAKENTHKLLVFFKSDLFNNPQKELIVSIVKKKSSLVLQSLGEKSLLTEAVVQKKEEVMISQPPLQQDSVLASQPINSAALPSTSSVSSEGPRVERKRMYVTTESQAGSQEGLEGQKGEGKEPPPQKKRASATSTQGAMINSLSSSFSGLAGNGKESQSALGASTSFTPLAAGKTKQQQPVISQIREADLEVSTTKPMTQKQVEELKQKLTNQGIKDNLITLTPTEVEDLYTIKVTSNNSKDLEIASKIISSYESEAFKPKQPQ